MTKDECKECLEQVLKKIEEETPEGTDLTTFHERFDNAREIHKFENDYIYVIVPDALTKLLIEKFTSRRMNELAEQLYNKKIGFKFITKDEAKKENEANPNLFAVPDKPAFDRSNRKLRAEFTFDNFVIGDSNRFAFVTAMKVAESPYAILNPLYMFGDVGLG